MLFNVLAFTFNAGIIYRFNGPALCCEPLLEQVLRLVGSPAEPQGPLLSRVRISSESPSLQGLVGQPLSSHKEAEMPREKERPEGVIKWCRALQPHPSSSSF